MLRLEDYDISPSTGFLPSTPPLECLPDHYYEPWETLISMLHNLMLAGRLREYVKQKLPILTTDHLQTPEEYRRAFLILSFIAHGYVWGKYETVSERLPANIAIPWVKVSKYLDVAPIINHAAVVTWNWSLIFPDEPFDLSNLATLITFTNTSDESWFYLVTTAIERFGGRILTSIMAAIQAANDGNNKILINELRKISSTIFDINRTLQKMFKKCDPYVFYWKVRPFLSGWENEDRLPQGLIYEGVDGNDENGNPIYRRYIGGSAGQSALIQTLDIALSVKHYPTGIKQHTNSSRHRCSNDYSQPHDTYQYITNGHIEPQQPYLHRIRQNIPGPHRRFLEDLSKSANIRNYIISTTNCDSNVNTSSSSSSDESEDMCLLRDPSKANDLIKAYNECLDQMKDFRKTHLNIVKFYIIKQARRGGDSHFNAKEVVPPVDKDLVGNNEITAVNSEIITTTTKSIEIIKGAGGTNLMPFLEQMRDETLDNNEATAVNNGIIATTTTKSIEVIKGTGGTNLIPFLEQMRDETTAQKIQ